MKESHFYRSIQGELEKKHPKKGKNLATFFESEPSEHLPMTLKDHWLSLRQSIQEKLPDQPQTADERKEIKILSELISPALVQESTEILRGFNEYTKKTDKRPHREFIDLDDDKISASIEDWIDRLIDEVQRKKATDLGNDEREEMRAQCWLLFQSVANVLNTKSLEKDIHDFCDEYPLEGDDKNEQKREKAECVGELQQRYPMNRDELAILFDLVKAENTDGEPYSPKVLVETISSLWSEYQLGQRKGTLAKISFGYLCAKAAESFAPSLFQNLIEQDKFNAAVFLEFFGLNKLSEVINAKTEIELAKVMDEINHLINERIINSIFFQEFEFIHEKSMGEIFAVIERGKFATQQMMRDLISAFAPMLAGIVMSAVFLTKINPILGAIGVVSLPAMYRVARKQNERVWPMYEQEMRAGEKIATQLGSIKTGFEEVRTSAETPTIARHAAEQMNVRDTLSLGRMIEEIKNRLRHMIPFDVSSVVAVGVGAAMQEAGAIPGGAILSSFMYSKQLNRPIQELVHLYFNRFSRWVQDIQRMDEVLGQCEALDLPEGEKERDRVPVTELHNFDISIKGLRYKKVLRGVNLEVKQGEFLTIAGASGTGKSTLLRCLVGLYRPDAGKTKIGGVQNTRIKKYGKDSVYSMMSYSNQSPQVFDGMTLRENLLLWSQDGVGDEKIKDVLRDLHLEKFANRLDQEVRYLSGGEKVRIGVARTLIKGAKILLLDEPTASLDSQSATEVRRILREIHEKYSDTTIICVSHDEELIKISGRAADISDLQKN